MKDNGAKGMMPARRPEAGRPGAGSRGASRLQDAWDALQRIDFGFCIFDTDLVLIAVNDYVRYLFPTLAGRLGPGLALQNLLAALHDAGAVPGDVLPAEWAAAAYSALLTGQVLELSLADGRVCRLSPTLGHDGSLAVTVQEVTQLKRAERRLREAKELAERASATKSRFLRAANHDLRQPLATLKILVYNCLTADSLQSRQEALHAMDLTVGIMEDLLSALLDVGQLDAGAIVPRIGSFPVASLFERLRMQFSHQAADKGLQLRMVRSHLQVTSDKLLLERILANFIANAIRYTDCGRILVGCRRMGDRLRIEVHDTGRGIAPEYQERIFDEFYRIDGNETDRERKALGLGLNIAKRLALLLEAPITLRSWPQRGSVFAIELPLGDIWRSEVGDTEISEMAGGEFAGVEILLIEDDPILRKALTALLERWGIVVHTAAGLSDACEVAMTARPDLVISDYRLPGGHTGVEICLALRDACKEDLPCIVITADMDEQPISDISQAGFPCLIKPVSPPRLRVLMHHLLFEQG